MCQLRKGTRTETREVLEGGVWKYCIALMIYVPFSFLYTLHTSEAVEIQIWNEEVPVQVCSWTQSECEST